jgi:hypothetical protein
VPLATNNSFFTEAKGRVKEEGKEKREKRKDNAELTEDSQRRGKMAREKPGAGRRGDYGAGRTVAKRDWLAVGGDGYA